MYNVVLVKVLFPAFSIKKRCGYLQHKVYTEDTFALFCSKTYLIGIALSGFLCPCGRGGGGGWGHIVSLLARRYIPSINPFCMYKKWCRFVIF